MNKHEIRLSMKNFLATLSDQERHTRSLAACENLIAMKEFKAAETIMIFMAMRQEVETSTLAIKAWGQGKSVAVPQVEWGERRMQPVEIQSLDVGMHLTGPGIREPISGKAVPLGFIDMVVIPGLAFDRRGLRVGRGQGFYDRFLAQREFLGIRCALCFHEQLLADPLPAEPHDVPMDLIVTDKEVVHCLANSALGRRVK